MSAIPGGFKVGDVVFYVGSSKTVSNGDKLDHGRTGTVKGPGTGASAGLVAVSFDGNKVNIYCFPEALSRDPPGPLPGGCKVGDVVFYVGASRTFPDGDKSTHGQTCTVKGPGTGTSAGEVAVYFEGNKGNITFHPEELSRSPPGPLPGGFKAAPSAAASSSGYPSADVQQLQAELATQRRQTQDLQRQLREEQQKAQSAAAEQTRKMQGLQRQLQEALSQAQAATASRDALQLQLQQLQAERDCEMGYMHASGLPQLSRTAEYGLHDVSLESPAAMFLCRLLTSSTVKHRKVRAQPEFAPAPELRVLKVEKVVNYRLYNKYMTAIEDLEGLYRDRGCEPFGKFPQLRVHPASAPTGRGELNEHFGFHGATHDVVSEICKAGFDPRRGGEGAGKMFGTAAYFAVNASKSDMYTDPSFTDRRPRSAERKIILARLALGRVLRVDRGCPDRTRPDDRYDSVWADTIQNGGSVDHPEIMIYKETQALPLYVITYVHACPPHQLCSECQKRPAR